MDVAARQIERAGLVGPIFFWELIRQSRKGRGYFTRILYAVAILGVLSLWFGGKEITQKNAAVLSEVAVQIYLSLQYSAVILLTPIFVGGAFVEDRQQNTLQLLMTTFLTPREIILGKLCGRLIHVFGVLLVGVPVLAMLQLLGGVEVTTLLLHSLLAFILMLVCGMYAIRASTLCKTVGGAIMLTYGMLIGGYFLSSVLSIPITVYLAVNLKLGGVLAPWYTAALLLNVVFSFTALRNAIRSLKNREKDMDYGSMQFMNDTLSIDQRRVLVFEAPVLKKATTPTAEQPSAAPEPPVVATQRLHRTIRWKRLPAVSDWPIFWKETYFPLSDIDALLAGICCGLPITVFLTSFVNHETFRSVRPFMIWCTQAMMMLVLVVTTLRAAGVFSQERIQQSLLSLLSVPLSRPGILLQAWLGSIWRYSACLTGTTLICFTTIAYQPLGTLYLVGMYVTQLALFTLAGTLLSMWHLSPFQARFLVGTLFFVGLVAAPAFVGRWLRDVPLPLTMMACPYQSWDLVNTQLEPPALILGSERPGQSGFRPRLTPLEDSIGGADVVAGILLLALLTGFLFLAANYRLKILRERLS